MAPALLLYAAVFVVPQAGLLAQSAYPDGQLSVDAYAAVVGDAHGFGVLLRTLAVGAAVAGVCLLLGFPLAYQLARTTSRWRGVLLGLTVFPLLTSAVVRTFGWQVIFYRTGPISAALRVVGIDTELIGTTTGVVVALAEVLLPFMVLTLYGVIRGIPAALEEAAQDLGDSPARAALHVVLPLARGGIVGGTLLVFSLAASSYVTPALIGGARVQVVATALYQQAISLVNYPRAAALAVVLLVVTGAIAIAQSRVLASAPASQAAGSDAPAADLPTSDTITSDSSGADDSATKASAGKR